NIRHAESGGFHLNALLGERTSAKALLILMKKNNQLPLWLAMCLFSQVALHNPTIDVLAVRSLVARVQVFLDRYQGLLRLHTSHLTSKAGPSPGWPVPMSILRSATNGVILLSSETKGV